MIQVQIPVATCSACLTAYTLDEWHKLQLVQEPSDDGLERRVCEICEAQMAFNLQGLEDCSLSMDVDLYEQLFPTSDRPRVARLAHALAIEQQQHRRRLIVGTVTGALVALFLAVLRYVM